MKKLIFLFLACVITLTSCSNEKDFDKNLKEAYNETVKVLLTSTLICDNISSTWRTAIFDHKGPDGRYCSDFNEALADLRTTYKNAGILDSISKYKTNMQSATSKLNNPPASRKECYNDFIEIVGEVSSLSRMATDPSGSLQSYSNQTNELASEISKKIDQFNIKYSQLIKENK